MNNVIVERKASTHQTAALVGCLFRLCHRLDLTPIPLKPKSKALVKWSDYQDLGLHLVPLVPLRPQSKIPLVKWKNYRLTDTDILRFLARHSNWAIRCDENLHVLELAYPNEAVILTAERSYRDEQRDNTSQKAHGSQALL